MSNPSVFVGTCLIFPISLIGTDDGSVATVATNLADRIRVRMNPDDNRQFGVLGLAPITGASVNVTCAGFVAGIEVDVDAVAPPTGLVIGTPIQPGTVPDWLSA
jgi:hypothetical protein